MWNGVYSYSMFLEPETDKIIHKIPFNTHGYIFKEVIGRGSYSVVFKVLHIQSKQEFAAKAIHIKYEVDHPTSNVCDSEIMALKQLCHPNIIKFYDSFHKYKHLFLILQLCNTGTIKSIIGSSSRLPFNVLASYMKQCLNALAFCHDKNIAHRDIKPENIFIDHYGRPLLADFGFSSQVFMNSRVNTFCGSLLYKAPEVIDKKPHSPMSADIWALGVTFYVMATGTSPWPNVSCEVVMEAIRLCKINYPDDMNASVGEVIKAMLVLDPKSRLLAKDLLDLPLFHEGSQRPLNVQVIKNNGRKVPLKNATPLCLRMGTNQLNAAGKTNLPANYITAINPVRKHNTLIIVSLQGRKRSMSRQVATEPIKLLHNNRHLNHLTSNSSKTFTIESAF